MDSCKPNEVRVIFCEMCPEEDRKPARKTCMKCEISMCVQHLQAHLTTPVLLQTHPLTEPMTLGGATKCPQHGKLVEYYCLDDMTCVCVSCAIEDQHRLHNMKTFSTAHKELMEKLSTEQKELLFKTDDENLSLEKWENREKEKLTSLSVRLIEAVSNLRDISLASVQSSVSARMVAIQTSKNSMQAAQNEKDTYRFLQMYSQVHQDLEKAKAVDLRKGMESGRDRDKLVKEVREIGEKLLEQAEEFWGSLLMMLDPENHQEFINTADDLVFDPQIFAFGMSLSQDKREVFYSSRMGQCSATLLIQSTNAAQINRWVISLPEDHDWIIGLCDKQCTKNLKSGPVYGLSCEDNQLHVLSTKYDDGFEVSRSGNKQQPKKQKIHSLLSQALSCQKEDGDEEALPQPDTVEVIWDFDASLLSFFSRPGQYQRQLISTLNTSHSHPDLTPFVKLGKENVQFTPEYNWRCSCGCTYDLRNITRHKGMISQSFGNAQNTCDCGAFIGGLCITELICKLV